MVISLKILYFRVLNPFNAAFYDLSFCSTSSHYNDNPYYTMSVEPNFGSQS